MWKTIDRRAQFYVYILKLATPNYYYIGHTGHMTDRFKSHRKGIGAYATTTYGWCGVLLGWYEFDTQDEAHCCELTIARKYRMLFPDAYICGDDYKNGQENRYYNLEYGSSRFLTAYA